MLWADVGPLVGVVIGGTLTYGYSVLANKREREHERRRALLALYSEFRLIYETPPVREPFEHELPSVAVVAVLPYLPSLSLADEERISKAIRAINIYNAAVRTLQATRLTAASAGREIMLGSGLARDVAGHLETVRDEVGSAYGDLERYLELGVYVSMPSNRKVGRRRRPRRPAG